MKNMKTLILAAAMMFGVAVSAQDKKERPEPLKPEQRAELRVKQMDLALDLNDKQEKDVQKLMLERSKKAEQFKAERKARRQAEKKLTADERFVMRSKMLDERIAMRDEMKKILTEEQFAKWENLKKEKHSKITKKHKKLKKHARR
jgi:protein CpxP